MEQEKKYKFIISKNKSYKQKYNITKKEPTPLDKIKELFVFEREETKSIKKNKKQSTFRTLGLIAIIFLLVFGGLIFYIISNLNYGYVIIPPSTEDINMNIIPIDYGLANIGGHNIFTPYISFDVETQKIDRVEYYMEATNGPLYNTVYLLNSNREQGTRYEEFKKSLREKMKLNGVTVNEISLKELRYIPEQTSAVVVIPTGYLPVQLINPETSIRKLAEKGFHVIYMGYNFDSGLIDEDKGRIFPSEYSVDSVANMLNLRATNAQGISGLKIRSNGIGYTSIKREETVINYVYGGVPVIKWMGDGSLIVLPESLDSGWTNGENAADDVSKLILESVAMKSYGKHIELTTPVKVDTSQNNTVVVNDIIITNGKENINEAYVRLVVRAYNFYNNKYNLEKVDSYYFYTKKDFLGTLLNKRYALSKELSGSLTELTVILNENRNQFPSAIPIFLKAYSSKGEVALETPFGTSYILPVDYTFKTEFNPKMSPGTYIIKLEDPSQTPYLFAKSIIQVPNVKLQLYEVPNWKENIFRFIVTTSELGQSSQYTKSLENTDVIINNKIVKKVKIIRIGETYIAEVSVPEGLEENKEHVFVFTAQEGLVYRGVSTINRAYYEQWWFWLVLVGAIVPVGIGILLRAKDKPLYSIDIPEFEVKKINKIKIKKEIFINLFDTINRDYDWTFMPLKMKEIKNGFRKITYMGRPVIIGDYNLSIILEKLKINGEINNYLDLYILTKWEKESKHDYKYLAMFRKVRDKFLNLAIPFSNINEREDCDIYVKSYRGEFKFVLGDGNDLYGRINRSLGSKEKVILVFKDEEDKMKFSENITMMGGGEGIKISIINNKLVMTTINEIQKIVK